MKKFLFSSILLVYSSVLLSQRKEFNQAIEKGLNSRGYIVISYKVPQNIKEINKLCVEFDFTLLAYRNDSGIKFGDNVNGPMHFSIMKNVDLIALKEKCSLYSVSLEVENLDSTIDKVNSIIAVEKARMQKEAEEKSRIEAIASIHKSNFEVSPNWVGFRVNRTYHLLQEVSVNGKFGIVFKGTNKWVIPPIYEIISNWHEKIFIVYKSKKINPEIYDINYNQIAWEVIGVHNIDSEGNVLQYIKSNRNGIGLMMTLKNGDKVVTLPPLAKNISPLIPFEKENLVFNGSEKNTIILAQDKDSEKYLFLNKRGQRLVDSVDYVEPNLFRLPVLPFTEFVVVRKNGSRYFIDPIKHEGYTEQAILKASNNINEVKLAEFFIAASIVTKGIAWGVIQLIKFAPEPIPKAEKIKKYGPDCGCSISEVERRGFIIKDACTTMEFKNGRTICIEYKYNKWRINNWLIDDKFNTLDELVKSAIETCKFSYCR